MPKFDGNIIKGQEYILVDDHTTNAGTLSALRDYIEDRGGKVVAMTTLSSSVGGNSPRLTDEQLRELKDIDYYGQLERTLTEAGYSHGFESLSKRTANFLLDKKNARGFERRRRLNAYGRGDRSTSQPLQRSGQNSARNLGLSRLVADVYNNSLEYALGEEVYQDFLDDAYSILKKSKGS